MRLNVLSFLLFFKGFGAKTFKIIENKHSSIALFVTIFKGFDLLFDL